MQKTSVFTIIFMALSVDFAITENPSCLLKPDFGEPKTKFKPFSMTQIYVPLWYKYTRFYYSTTNYKCVEFPYWGQGGNANNFKTIEKCQLECANYSHIPPPALSTEGNCTSLSCDNDPSDLLPNCKLAKLPKNSNDCCAPVTCTEKKVNSDKMCLYNIATNNQMVIQAGQKLPVSYYPCFECKCNTNFKGIITTEGEVCKEINCGLSFSYYQSKLDAGCQPDYFFKNTNKYRKPSCCPSQWKCPSVAAEINASGRVMPINATSIPITRTKTSAPDVNDAINARVNDTTNAGVNVTTNAGVNVTTNAGSNVTTNANDNDTDDSVAE